MRLSATKKAHGAKLLDEIFAALPEFAPPLNPGAVANLPTAQVGVATTDADLIVTLPDTATPQQIAAVNSIIAAHTPTPAPADPDLTLPEALKKKVRDDQDFNAKEMRQAVKHILKRIGSI